MIRASDFFDSASYIRGQDDVAREHARMEISEGTLDLGALILVGVGVLVLWAALGWVR